MWARAAMAVILCGSVSVFMNTGVVGKDMVLIARRVSLIWRSPAIDPIVAVGRIWFRAQQ